MYLFSEVEARVAKPQTIYNIIHDLLSADQDASYAEMERYLRGAANTGSTQFDHANAVRVLLDHDKRHGGYLHAAMVENDLTLREIWDRLNRVLIKAGFKFANGKMVGTLLEDKSSDATNDDEANQVAA
jgi:hypothetical protein